MTNSDRRKVRRAPVYSPDGLNALLLQAAAGPCGVHAPDVQGWTTARVSNALWLLAGRAELFRARLGHRKVHYFATAAAAQAFEATHAHRYVAPQPLRPPVELAEDRTAQPGSARAMLHQVNSLDKLRANAALVPQAGRPPVPITYCPSPQTGPLSGHCPPDRPLVMRAGALDYQRYMPRYSAT